MIKASQGRSFLLFACAPLLGSCYTLGQAYHQARLLWQREDLSEVVASDIESPERLEKLRLVPKILDFAKERVGLRPGDSYRTYVRLPEGSKALTWVVQAAEKRQLVRKTWWFPLVGSQPYLGFFDVYDAKAFRAKLQDEGYDTRLGGVDAFSLLGYLSDPLYSSMIDGRSLIEIVELLIHESVHRTLYVPDQSTFNESFADFVAKRATVAFAEEYKDVLGESAHDADDLLERAARELEAGRRFRGFLADVTERLESFYEEAAQSDALREDDAFLVARQTLFESFQEDYVRDLGAVVTGTSYERAFQADRMNNAVILGYSLYEARPEPFEGLLDRSGGSLSNMIVTLESCLKGDWPSQETTPAAEGPVGASHEAIWPVIEKCGAVVMQGEGDG